MALNKRERIIAMAVGGLLVVTLGYTQGYERISKAMDDTQKLIDKEKKKLQNGQQLISEDSARQTQWNDLLRTVLTTRAAEGGQQLEDAILNYGNQTRVNVTNIRPNLDRTAGRFHELRYQVKISGFSTAIWKFLYALETSKLPLMINDLKISSDKEGTEPLTADLTLTTLVFAPPVPTRPAGRGAATVASRPRGPESVPGSTKAADDSAAIEAKMRQARERQAAALAGPETVAAPSQPSSAPASAPATRGGNP